MSMIQSSILHPNPVCYCCIIYDLFNINEYPRNVIYIGIYYFMPCNACFIICRTTYHDILSLDISQIMQCHVTDMIVCDSR